MGIAYSIDAPLRVAKYGINSVLSIMDDALLDKVRKVYSEKYGIPYTPIPSDNPEARSNRVKAFLDMVDYVTQRQVDEFKSNCSIAEAIKFLDLLPTESAAYSTYQQLTASGNAEGIIELARNTVTRGRVEVNIMTKLDKTNEFKGKELSREYNDAHASLRGFANSSLQDAMLVLSAGMNPALFSYMATFQQFLPNEQGQLTKKVAIKVSDYRSALIQGKFLAKKGIWVSEFRVESGLNCGGHAFATEGYLMGPILEEFSKSRNVLLDTMLPMYNAALAERGMAPLKKAPHMALTAQGGVGTSAEHQFLLHKYGLDSVGWGSPFLLVPEVTCVDRVTRTQLAKAREEDLYMSDISPLGVIMNNMRGNTKDLDKFQRADAGRPGSPCPKKHLTFNTEFTDKPICTASRQYQNKKINELKEQDLTAEQFEAAYEKVIEKACICTGLGMPFLMEHGFDTKQEGEGVSICPGPNIAYYEKEMTLKEMVDHIYGRANVITRTDRPHMFIKELGLYLEHLKGQLMESDGTARAVKGLGNYMDNLKNAIGYYHGLLADSVLDLAHQQQVAFADFLTAAEEKIQEMALMLHGNVQLV
jgi:hypothetical protein